MRNLVTIYLHGELGDKYGDVHVFRVGSAREVVSAMNANYPGFRRDFLASPFYGLIIDGDNRHEGNCHDPAGSPIANEIHFVPMIEGRITGLLAAGIAALVPALAGTAATLIAAAIQIGLLIGVSLLLAPKIETPDDDNKDNNYAFSGPDNVVEQGGAVPVIYGRCFVGSVVVSAGLEIADAFTDEAKQIYEWLTPEQPTFSRNYPDAIDEPLPRDVPAPVDLESVPYVPGNA